MKKKTKAFFMWLSMSHSLQNKWEITAKMLYPPREGKCAEKHAAGAPPGNVLICQQLKLFLCGFCLAYKIYTL